MHILRDILYEHIAGINHNGFITTTLPLSEGITTSYAHWVCRSLSLLTNQYGSITTLAPWIILCMRPANERWRYTVTPSLIGWAHTQIDPSGSFIIRHLQSQWNWSSNPRADSLLWIRSYVCSRIMITSWHGDTFHITTGPLWGESTGSIQRLTFMFDRCHRSSAMENPDKYGVGIQQVVKW